MNNYVYIRKGPLFTAATTSINVVVRSGIEYTTGDIAPGKPRKKVQL